MTFPFDGEQITPLQKDLIGDLAARVAADYYYAFTMETAPGTPYDALWIVANKLIVKRRPDDADADLVAEGTVTVDQTTPATGEVDFMFTGSDLTLDYAGTLYYAWHASDGTNWIPMVWGRLELRAEAMKQGS